MTTAVFAANGLLSLGGGIWWLAALEFLTAVLAGACWALGSARPERPVSDLRPLVQDRYRAR